MKIMNVSQWQWQSAALIMICVIMKKIRQILILNARRNNYVY